MAELLHVSDLHFGSPFLPDRAEAVHRLAEAHPPDAVVVSGDLTQRAKEREFRQAAEYLDRFRVPVVVVPGNHDVPLYRVWERFLWPYAKYRKHVSEELDTVTVLEDTTIVALNSSRSFTIDNGRLERDQLAFAAEALAGAPEGHRKVVVTHHHLAPPPDFSTDSVMPRAKRALELFRDHGVHLILAGHMHRAYIGDSLDFFPGEEREEGIVIAQCGTTTSSRGRGRERLANSLNYIRMGPDRLLITHYLWRDSRGEFWPHSRHRFGVAPDIWLGRTQSPFARDEDLT